MSLGTYIEIHTTDHAVEDARRHYRMLETYQQADPLTKVPEGDRTYAQEALVELEHHYEFMDKDAQALVGALNHLANLPEDDILIMNQTGEEIPHGWIRARPDPSE